MLFVGPGNTRIWHLIHAESKVWSKQKYAQFSLLRKIKDESILKGLQPVVPESLGSSKLNTRKLNLAVFLFLFCFLILE